MTDLELFTLLSSVSGRYIQEAEDFRSGKTRAASRRSRFQVLRVLSAAAMLALVVVAGVFTLRHTPKSSSGEAALSGTTASASSNEAASTEDSLSLPQVTAELLGRDAYSSLTYYPEGQETVLPARLFIGQGYSLYIPERNWEHTTVSYHYDTADRWTYAYNPEITLTIVRVATADGQPPYEYVMQANTGFRFTIDADGNLITDYEEVGPETGMKYAQFIAAGDSVYYVLLSEYPVEAAEGAGVLLNAVTDSFVGWPSEIPLESPIAEVVSSAPEPVLDFSISGEMHTLEAMPAKLDGYMLYVPKVGWSHSTLPLADTTAHRWASDKVPEICLTAVALDTASLEEAQKRIQDAMPQYTYVAASDGTLYNENDLAHYSEVLFRELQSGLLALILEYPADGSYVSLTNVPRAIAGSFSPSADFNTTVNRPEILQQTLSILDPDADRYLDYTVSFQLHVTQDYSFYTPQDGWSYAPPPDERWYAQEDPNVWFQVISLGNQDFSQGLAWAEETYGGEYPGYEGKDGSFWGTNKDGTLHLAVGFAQGSIGLYALVRHFPGTAYDILTPYVNVMADTFLAR